MARDNGLMSTENLRSSAMPGSHPITAKDRGLTPRQDETNATIIAEAVNVLKSRGDFDQTAFCDYLVEAVLFVLPPDVRTPKWNRRLFESIANKYISAPRDQHAPKWTHKTAEALADKFAVWRAGGLQ